METIISRYDRVFFFLHHIFLTYSLHCGFTYTWVTCSSTLSGPPWCSFGTWAYLAGHDNFLSEQGLMLQKFGNTSGRNKARAAQILHIEGTQGTFGNKHVRFLSRVPSCPSFLKQDFKTTNLHFHGPPKIVATKHAQKKRETRKINTIPLARTIQKCEPFRFSNSQTTKMQGPLGEAPKTCILSEK